MKEILISNSAEPFSYKIPAQRIEIRAFCAILCLAVILFIFPAAYAVKVQPVVQNYTLVSNDERFTTIYRDYDFFLFVLLPLAIILCLISFISSDSKWMEKQPFNFTLLLIIMWRIWISTSGLLSQLQQIQTNLYINMFPYNGSWKLLSTLSLISLGLVGLSLIWSIIRMRGEVLTAAEQYDSDMNKRVNKFCDSFEIIKKYQLDKNAIALCDEIGASSFFSVRSLTIYSSVFPALVTIFISKATLSVLQCYGYLTIAQNEENQENYVTGIGQVSVYMCQSLLDQLNVSLQIPFFNLKLEGIVILAVIVTVIYIMIRGLIILHTYRAKLFGAKIRLSDEQSMKEVGMDILWNAFVVYPLFFMLLDLISTDFPTQNTKLMYINGVPKGNQETLMAVYPNDIQLRNSEGILYTGVLMNFQMNLNWIAPFAYIALLGSLYGFMYHAKTSALLSFYKEKDIVKFASNHDIRVKFELYNEGSRSLEFIRRVYEKNSKNPSHAIVQAIIEYFEEISYLKQLT